MYLARGGEAGAGNAVPFFAPLFLLIYFIWTPPLYCQRPSSPRLRVAFPAASMTHVSAPVKDPLPVPRVLSAGRAGPGSYRRSWRERQVEPRVLQAPRRSDGLEAGWRAAAVEWKRDSSLRKRCGSWGFSEDTLPPHPTRLPLAAARPVQAPPRFKALEQQRGATSRRCRPGRVRGLLECVHRVVYRIRDPHKSLAVKICNKPSIFFFFFTKKA